MLDFQQRLLTRKCWLDIGVCLDRAQAHTGCMFGVVENTRVRIARNRAMVPKKGERFCNGRHFSGIIGMRMQDELLS